LIHQVALEIPHPTDANRSLWDARGDQGPYTGEAHPDAIAIFEEKQRTQSAGTGVFPLGSGSDFTAFLQRIGVRKA
jgi:N-acetylated-alpha-linked acidic dipeptidase